MITLENRYIEGASYKELSKEFNIPIHKIRYILQKSNVYISSRNEKLNKRKAQRAKGKLNIDQVREIRSLHKQGVYIRILADKFGVHRSTIENIIYLVTWREPEHDKLLIEKKEKEEQLIEIKQDFLRRKL